VLEVAATASCLAQKSVTTETLTMMTAVVLTARSKKSDAALHYHGSVVPRLVLNVQLPKQELFQIA